MIPIGTLVHYTERPHSRRLRRCKGIPRIGFILKTCRREEEKLRVKNELGQEQEVDTKEIKYLIGATYVDAELRELIDNPGKLQEWKAECRRLSEERNQMEYVVFFWHWFQSQEPVKGENTVKSRYISFLLTSRRLDEKDSESVLFNYTEYFDQKPWYVLARHESETKLSQISRKWKRELYAAFEESFKKTSTEPLQILGTHRSQAFINHLRFEGARVDCFHYNKKQEEAPGYPFGKALFQTLSLFLEEHRPEMVLNQTTKDICFNVLCGWGEFTTHQNLPILYLSPDYGKEGSLLLNALSREMAETATKGNVDDRRELFGSSFAIDSSDTMEVDDAVGWDSESGSVLVHIADVTHFLCDTQDNDIVREALRRTKTMYLPDGKYLMLPKDLVGYASLTSEEYAGKKYALTFQFRVTEQGSVDEDSIDIFPSLIEPPKRLEQAEAEDILQGKKNHDIGMLYENAKKLNRYRSQKQNPGSRLKEKETIRVSHVCAANPEIIVEKRRTFKLADFLVAELMITTNTLVARAFPNMPAIFRGYDEDVDSIVDGVDGGQWHGYLGVRGYCRVTSPLRRFEDLAAHFQIKSCIRGARLPYSRRDLEDVVTALFGADKKYGTRGLQDEVETRCREYWILEALRQAAPRDFDGVIGDCVDGEASFPVRLDGEWAKYNEANVFSSRGRPDAPVTKGGRGRLRVTSVDTRNEEVQAEFFPGESVGATHAQASSSAAGG